MRFMEPLLVQLKAMWIGLVQTLPSLALALIALLVTWLVVAITKRIVKTLIGRAQLRRSLQELLLTILGTGVWTIGILVALTIIFPSLTPAKLLAALGLGSVAVGFAFKDIFENFLAGILIMLRKPMRIGDFIECEAVSGVVEQITIRDTYVRKLDDELILVPNSYLYTNPVFVTTDKPLRRYDIVCGVSYDTDVDEARQVIQRSVSTLDCIESSKPVEVYACEFNSSSVDFTVRWWAHSKPIDMHKSRDEVIRAIKRALDDAGIEIPFPYRTLTFKEPLPLTKDAT